jgi:hypothetical protein
MAENAKDVNNLNIVDVDTVNSGNSVSMYLASLPRA